MSADTEAAENVGVATEEEVVTEDAASSAGAPKLTTHKPSLTKAHHQWVASAFDVDPLSYATEADVAFAGPVETEPAAGRAGVSGTTSSNGPSPAADLGGASLFQDPSVGEFAPSHYRSAPEVIATPAPDPTPEDAQNQKETEEAEEDEAFAQLLKLREGSVNTVYLDSLGKPTVGIGHMVRPDDHLSVGDTITDEQAAAFFKKDGASAMSAARKQAVEAGISDPSFVPNLASVNFQLGTGWTKTFKNTWAMVVDGKYDEAAKALDGTAWAKQTPVRVKDFQDALGKLPPKAGGDVQSVEDTKPGEVQLPSLN